MGCFIRFSKRTDCWYSRLAGESVTKAVTSLVVSRATIPTVIAVCTNHGKTSSAERNSGRKPKPSERERRTLKRIVSKIRGPTAAKVSVELSVYREDPVSTKTVGRKLHRSSIHGRSAFAVPLVTENGCKR